MTTKTLFMTEQERTNQENYLSLDPEAMAMVAAMSVSLLMRS